MTVGFSNVNSSALAQSAQVLTHPYYYSDTDLAVASETINAVAQEDTANLSELDQQYVKLAQSIQSYQNGEISKSDIDNEMLNTFMAQNSENNVSSQVLNEVSLAYNQLGRHEALDGAGYGTDSGEEISQYFETGMYGSPWCAMFVSWLNDNGQSNPTGNSNTFGFQESVAGIRGAAQEAGCYESKDSYEPEAGDLMVLENGGSSHIGMVYDSDDENVYTIEGNKLDMVRAVVYDKDGSYYPNHVSGYVKMNNWTGGNTTENINTEFLPDLETAVLPETQCYASPNNWDDYATGGTVNVYPQ